MATSYVVAAYEVSRCYGGPEEGGWWYNQYELIRAVKVFRNIDKAYKYTNRLNTKLASTKFGPNQGKRDMYSVAGDDWVQVRVFENTAPKSEPEERQYYC